MSSTPKFGLPYVDLQQASQDVPHNTTVGILDIISHLAISNIVTPTNTPPGSPANGDCYLVGASPTGVFASQNGNVAIYLNGWYFKTPFEGMRAYDKNADALYSYNGSAWSVVSASSTGIVPISGIVAWHKTLTGTPALPAQFVECNGQTLSDGASPLNGQVIPNLNNSGGAAANRFLRGATTSGTTSGSISHSHTVLGSVSVDNNIPSVNVVPQPGGSTSSENHEPPYMNVVWVMRVK